ncbi:MAG: hypothetical protein MUC65_06725 [Pontiellaceae bacterium]|jgi:hypothetical protein|nr:hypothetical protein [Pontiellaceae bacterium]
MNANIREFCRAGTVEDLPAGTQRKLVAKARKKRKTAQNDPQMDADQTD